MGGIDRAGKRGGGGVEWGVVVSKYICIYIIYIFFFFNDTATTEIYTLSLHDALPIWIPAAAFSLRGGQIKACQTGSGSGSPVMPGFSVKIGRAHV